MPGREDSVRWVLPSRSNEELAERYDAWAEEYDADLQSYGYRSPAIAVGIMGRYVPRDSSPILDAGAGTGIMGEVLNTLRYKGITAFDLSNYRRAHLFLKGNGDRFSGKTGGRCLVWPWKSLVTLRLLDSGIGLLVNLSSCQCSATLWLGQP